nr:PREDICTED: vespryn-like [Lepisosteus oculatus]
MDWHSFSMSKLMDLDFRDVTFNPDTAHTKLEVSHDKLEVCWSKLPFPQGENSERFDSQYSVLAENKLSDGQHYWEVIL